MLDGKTYLIGNWKCNKGLDQVYSWFDTFARCFQPVAGLEVLIAPPMIWLGQCRDYIAEKNIAGLGLVAQDLSPFPSGSYTGAVSADMIKGIARFALVGHSERRRYFHETSQDVTNKVSEAEDAGITPVVCVDKAYAMSQLVALNALNGERMIIAYCPTGTLAYREPESIESVTEAVSFLSGIVAGQPIVYGGAITAGNSRRYRDVDGLSGLFVGAASLDAEEFCRICRNFSV